MVRQGNAVLEWAAHVAAIASLSVDPGPFLAPSVVASRRSVWGRDRVQVRMGWSRLFGFRAGVSVRHARRWILRGTRGGGDDLDPPRVVALVYPFWAVPREGALVFPPSEGGPCGVLLGRLRCKDTVPVRVVQSFTVVQESVFGEAWSGLVPSGQGALRSGQDSTLTPGAAQPCPGPAAP